MSVMGAKALTAIPVSVGMAAADRAAVLPRRACVDVTATTATNRAPNQCLPSQTQTVEIDGLRPASIKRELANVAASEFSTDGMAPYVCGQITE
jgi:hypothetical protein